MKSQQSGFTLIELIVVIVILGILAAVAVPRFINLSDEAEEAAVKATAGAMGSAMALNYAACVVDNSAANTKCRPVANCAEVDSLLEGGYDTERYSITEAADLGNTMGDAGTCTVAVKGKTDVKADFTVIVATQS